MRCTGCCRIPRCGRHLPKTRCSAPASVSRRRVWARNTRAHIDRRSPRTDDMQAPHQPFVSVGLPADNGARYVASAVESVLSQSVDDLELIVSDNASTDDTLSVVRDAAAHDARIRYHRNPENVGGSRNHNLTFRLSRGRYFMWAACDDVRASTFLERCAAVLEQRPEAVAVYTKTRYIGPNDEPLSDEDRDMPFDDPDVQVRFRAAIELTHTVAPLLGLIRSDVLLDTR